MLIEEVIADIDAEAGEIILLVHWAGGVHAELRLPRRRRGQRNSTPQDIVAAVRLLARIASDDLIAGILKAFRKRVQSSAAVVLSRRLPSQDPPQERSR